MQPSIWGLSTRAQPQFTESTVRACHLVKPNLFLLLILAHRARLRLMIVRGSQTCESKIRRAANSLLECRISLGSGNVMRALWLRPSLCYLRWKVRRTLSKTTSKSYCLSSCKIKKCWCKTVGSSHSLHQNRAWKRALELHPVSSKYATMSRSTQGKCPRWMKASQSAASTLLASQTFQRSRARTLDCKTHTRWSVLAFNDWF